MSFREALTVIHRAMDFGVNFVDTADTYNRGDSEVIIGRSLRGLRNGMLLATKVGKSIGPGPNDRGSSRYRIINGVEASLRRLRTDHIDLHRLHDWDPETPLEDPMRTLDDLVRCEEVFTLAPAISPLSR